MNNFKCGFECIFNETGVLVNGVLDQNLAYEFTRKGYANNTQWINFTLDGIDYCLKEVTKLLPEIEKKFNKSSINQVNICHPYSGFLIQCMFGHNFINCPVSVYVNSSACNHFKQYLVDCHNSIEFY